MASRYEALREAIGAFDVKIRSLSDLGIDYRRNESAGETTASLAPLNAHKAVRYYPALLSVEGSTTGSLDLWAGLATQSDRKHATARRPAQRGAEPCRPSDP
jgi:hypothetical protein